MGDSFTFLIGDVSRLMRRRFDERARAIGVTRAQWKLIFTLSRNEGANQGALAELIDVEPITIGRMVDRLEEAGMVERRPDPRDRRAWRLYLTDKAQPLLTELRVLGDAMVEEVMAGIDDAERDRATAILEIMRARLTANGDAPDSSTKVADHG
ncbi:MAG: MarR family transcriptional regulator [Sphingomonas sanxanigenens]|uniref:MarR family transcriptional regulator n=1 Tax=Sphingomonas sanxanigenens TaxID=397260 RepID=A0A2W4ZWU6_9SPHN|nr:MAG: MarR family transcriptional regulator [Sphingomonas sanxanigenens]